MKYRLFAAFALVLLAATAHSEVIHRAKSLYQDIYVRDTGPMRCMQFQADNTIIKHYQGCIYMNSRKMAFHYSEAFMATLLMNPNPSRILVIGLGGGVVPRAMRDMVPGALIEVVEIDPEVVSIARQYFGWMEDDARMRTYVADGRAFVKGAAQQGIKYDIVLLDAFNAEYVPEHMMTLDFLEEVKTIMNPTAVFGSNTFARSRLYDHESMTYTAAFGDFFNLQMDGKSSNRVILGGGTQLPEVEFIRANAIAYAARFWGAHEIHVNDLLTNMENAKDWDQDARALTDQYSPANVLAGHSRLDGSFKNAFASGLETMADERPYATAIGLLALVIAFLMLVMKFFDFLVSMRKQTEAEATE